MKLHQLCLLFVPFLLISCSDESPSSPSSISSDGITVSLDYSQRGIDPAAPEQFVAPQERNFACPSETRYSDLVSLLPTPAAVKGYSFDNWYVGDPENGGYLLKSSSEIIEPGERIELYAKFSPRSYSIYWDYSGATFTPTKTARRFDENVPLSSPSFQPIREEYPFAGWADGASGEVISEIPRFTEGDISLKATWSSPNQYAITYSCLGVAREYETDILNKANNPNPHSYTTEDEILLEEPSIEGYRFVHWENEGAIVTSIPKGSSGAVELIAIFEPEFYTVAFANLKGGSMTAHTYLRSDNEYVLPKAPEVNGWKFLGWKDEQGEFIASIPHGSCENYILTAEWSKEVGQVIYQFPGIDIDTLDTIQNPNPNTFDIETSFDLADASLDGYDFLGWYLPGGANKRISSVTPELFAYELTIEGRFKLHSYAIRFEGVQGCVNENRKSYTLEDGQILLSPARKPGYLFLGWTDESGTYITSIDSSEMKDRSLTANWQITTYRIQYASVGVSEEFLNTVQFPALTSYTILTSGEELSLPSASAPGYEFLGWYEDEACQKQILAINPTRLQDVICYAKFVPTAYRITYINIDGAKNANPAIYTIESDTIELLDPEKLGYRFSGWREGSLIPHGSTGDRSFEATWDLEDYHLSFHCSSDVSTELGFDSAFQDNNPINHYTIEDETFELADASCKGYSFLGWVDDETGNRVREIRKGSTGDRSFSARFQKIEYSVTYSSEKTYAPIGNPTSFTVETPNVPLASPVCPGYDFLGWVDESGQLVTEIPQGTATNISLTACWSDAISYDISYQFTGLAEEFKDDIVFTPRAHYTVNDEFALPTPSCPGYTFDNWSTEYVSKGTTGNLVITGTFRLQTYQIYYVNLKSQTNNNVLAFTVEDDAIALKPLTHPEYTFAGWVNDATGESITNIGGGETGSITLRAVWSLLGAGTKTDPKLIFNTDQLREIEKAPTLVYALQSNIVIQGSWDPIGDSSNPFTGDLLGFGHSITFSSATPASTKFGLFDVLSGNVSDLKIGGNTGSEASRTTCSSYGALAIDFNGGEKAVTKVATIVTSFLKTSSSSLIAGGLFSKLSSGYIRKCTNNGRIDGVVSSGNGCDVGGIVGDAIGGTLSDCQNLAGGALVASAPTVRVGGIIGQRKYPSGTSVFLSSKSLIDDCSLGALTPKGTTSNERNNYVGFDAVTDLPVSKANIKAPKADPEYKGDGYFYMTYYFVETIYNVPDVPIFGIASQTTYWAMAWVPYVSESLSEDMNSFVNSIRVREAPAK
ncbi:MAG: InlB B-repeat-containing protein [Candidatus Enteromonas sp.]|nr:InlB B-repeat-containing protein [Candidatus Enteromonas sp.]